MATRGRPPKAEGALTATQRKQAQRERDRIAAWSDADVLPDATTEALSAVVSLCLSHGYTDRLELVLKEIARRGGLKITVR